MSYKGEANIKHTWRHDNMKSTLCLTSCSFKVCRYTCIYEIASLRPKPPTAWPRTSSPGRTWWCCWCRVHKRSQTPKTRIKWRNSQRRQFPINCYCFILKGVFERYLKETLVCIVERLPVESVEHLGDTCCTELVIHPINTEQKHSQLVIGTARPASDPPHMLHETDQHAARVLPLWNRLLWWCMMMEDDKDVQH